ncbi:Crp/Fnr family transcriptional regulator [Maribacter sp. HTCC2170]|uniref:Crp/Fnr family transcriptional regulator n=1 Tax=Maribacter sp. (strain HTCC2170 / KCCM 42371) TaxID=313603 RepID=UPI00006B224E|nr:Crp/Fnr family transcriptional regulator [Maribacter sp. HTCC2170]EAR00356.1 cAMP-binding protein - catabolite gene activator and regulatory subunit of cAMP-dependent protein kinase [Maribacter sp. HTCC2170]
MSSFLDILNQDLNPSREIEALKAKISVKTFKKGEILQRNGDRISRIYYVKKGLLRSYMIDDKGKEHIFMFAPEDWIIADGADFSSPCQLFIDVLEDSEIEIINKKLFEEEYIPETLTSDKQRTAAMIKRISVLQERVIMLMSATAIERYEHFKSTYPQIMQRVPQRMIASYLGITPEALSKVKGKRAKSN